MEAISNTTAALQPQRGESEEDFIVRAHHALASHIPDPSQRNQAIWQAWDGSMGNPLLDQAAQYFGAEQYNGTEPRPFFMEHEKVNYGADGSEQITNYDLSELTKIVRENNHRIQDTDAYTALVDKHTLPPPYRDPDPPKNLGFVGPYRLGMLGKKNPRWAIFANEWQRADKTEQLRDRPNRSVEVLQLKANGRRYIDPIAALSEAPRLPLPTTAQYAAESPESDAVTVERYDASPALAAYPGGSNTFIKSPKKDKDMYGGKAVDSDMIREVLNALMSTEEFKMIQEAAQKLGENQPVISGQDVLPEPPMEEAMPDPMAGGLPEPEMPMGDPGMEMMGDEPMPPGMEEEEVVEADMEEEMPDQNMGMYGGMHTKDRNAAPLAAAAGRAAAGGAARGAAAKGGGTMGQMAKGAATDLAVQGIANKMGGEKPAQERPKGILARILEGPTQANAEASPQTFGATPGYHRYDSSAEGNMKRDQYAALTAENKEMRSELDKLKAHNDSLLTEQAQMYAATQHEVVQLRQNAIDAERKERLTHLAHQYSAVDLNREMDECLYASGSEMSNEEFDKRVELIQQYCAVSAAQSPMIPIGYDGSLANGDVQSDKFAAQVADRALELVNTGIKSGKRLTYQEAVDTAKSELTKE